MTAVSHDGLSPRRLRSQAGAIRTRVGSRLVRPGGQDSNTRSRSRTSRGDSGEARVSPAQSVSASGVATASANPLGINLGALTPGTAIGSLRLVVAGHRVRLSSGAFLILVLGLLSTILVSLLLLNTALAENSFQLQKIRQSARDLTVREQTLSGQLAAAESPIGLEKRAMELGMVAAGSPVFLRLSDGKVLGESIPAEAPALAKPKKPKAPAVVDPYAGEFPVGSSPWLDGFPSGTTTGSTGTGLTGAHQGETVVGTTSGSGAVSEFTTGAPVGGESPVGLVRGTTR